MGFRTIFSRRVDCIRSVVNTDAKVLYALLQPLRKRPDDIYLPEALY